jgi:phage terminase large subunit-like protein
MVHPISLINPHGEIKTKVIVDMIKFWKPSKEGPVNITIVENEIRNLCKKFRVAQVTFDSFQSAQTIQRLSLSGIKAKETPFTATHITAVYGELRNLLINKDVVLPPNQLLIGEMKNLRYKFIARGFKRMFDPKSEYPSDDCCDALAGACYEALHIQVMKQLPRGVLVRTGFK